MWLKGVAAGALVVLLCQVGSVRADPPIGVTPGFPPECRLPDDDCNAVHVWPPRGCPDKICNAVPPEVQCLLSGLGNATVCPATYCISFHVGPWQPASLPNPTDAHRVVNVDGWGFEFIYVVGEGFRNYAPNVVGTGVFHLDYSDHTRSGC